MIENHLVVYLTIVGITGMVILWLLKRTLMKVEEARKSRLKQLDQFNAVPTRSPLKNPLRNARKNALENLGIRFTIIKRAIYFTLLTVWLIALLFPFMGNVPATMVSLLVAASAVIVGIAARPFVENLISGIVISFSNQLRTGDTLIIDDHYGTVEDISITHTVIKLWNWKRYIIPNSNMVTKNFLNYDICDSFLWEHVEFWVAPDSDMEKVEQIALRVASNSTHFAKYEPPRFWITELAKEGVRCWIAAWAENAAEAWLLKTDIRMGLMKEFHAAGIKTHVYHYQKTEPVQETQTTPLFGDQELADSG